MKIFLATAIAALFMLSACASEYGDSGQAVRHVDEWAPLVQVSPPRNLWETQAYEAECDAPATTPNSPVYDIDYHMLTPNERVMRWRAYELQRAFNFFFPDEQHFFTSTAQVYPCFFGGFELSRHDAIVMIVEGKEYEAREFLEYIANFSLIDIFFVPYSFNEIVNVHRQILSANVYPRRWRVNRNHLEGHVRVELFNYSHDEKEFFRTYVLDSPFIRFSCVYNADERT